MLFARVSKARAYIQVVAAAEVVLCALGRLAAGGSRDGVTGGGGWGWDWRGGTVAGEADGLMIERGVGRE